MYDRPKLHQFSAQLRPPPMKIDQLPLGARFRWKGRNYTKVGPMTASADAGGVDFIPKHAALQPIPAKPRRPIRNSKRRRRSTR